MTNACPRPWILVAFPLAFAAAAVCVRATAQVTNEAETIYVTEIKPLLRARCYSCHGALKQESGLRLDTVAAITRGGDSGPVITATNASASRLIERVSATDITQRMPPEHEGEPLTAQQINVIQKWIGSGAAGPTDEKPEQDPKDHWSFRPIVRPPVPQVSRVDWVKNPIDAFVARQHETLGLTPQGEASRIELLRRLSLDLVGLPPDPDEISRLQADVPSDWYDQTVTRLLEDPRHGERWARHWMDIWRYSDWWGLGDQLRNSQPHIWHWRDWIIESLNADTPYDEIVRLMLAADELHPNDLGKLRATGFLARNYFLFNRNQWMDETVEHTAKAFLGLTVNCAKCHDHKYDPISHADYYRMRAFFEPYHVRLDILPGESDLVRDGIPRVFDGLPDLPTYRFIRGQEKDPDKSSPIGPGIPSMLEFEPLTIQPVDLPVEAWQPERRPWVAEAYLGKAQAKLRDAEAKLIAAREKLAKAELPSATTSGATDAAAQAPEPAASVEAELAQFAVDAARAEVKSIECRIAAMQAKWSLADSGETPESVQLATGTARMAARSERELSAARARLSLAEAERKRKEAPADKQEAAEKELVAAREAFEKATKSIEEAGEQFTPLVGAQWTPTRFFNSLKDDPTVTFHPRSTGRRKALAEWITDRRNPLTARVAVNHIWTRHIGTPLVPTVFDFGRKGSTPGNPELLDWLAAEFIESGWSMKHLHRLIVQSATYRLSASSGNAEPNEAIDPDNAHFWRRTPVRLESQAVRDSILSLAGKLDPTLGGPPVPLAQQSESTRRSLYFFHSNNERNLFLRMFDEALVKECYRREQSIVPQQALALSNSRLVLDASHAIAERLTNSLANQQQSIGDDQAFVRLAFAVLLATPPSDAEITASLAALDSWRKLPDANAARANLVWVLLNHNDFVTMR